LVIESCTQFTHIYICCSWFVVTLRALRTFTFTAFVCSLVGLHLPFAAFQLRFASAPGFFTRFPRYALPRFVGLPYFTRSCRFAFPVTLRLSSACARYARLHTRYVYAYGSVLRGALRFTHPLWLVGLLLVPTCYRTLCSSITCRVCARYLTFPGASCCRAFWLTPFSRCYFMPLRFVLTRTFTGSRIYLVCALHPAPCAGLCPGCRPAPLDCYAWTRYAARPGCYLFHARSARLLVSCVLDYCASYTLTLAPRFSSRFAHTPAVTLHL